MKKIILLIILLNLKPISMKAQEQNQSIEKTILEFAEAADNRDISVLTSVLHDEFRVTLNHILGAEKVTILTKPLYLEMTKSGKIGGDKRKIEIVSIDQTENNAIAKVSLSGNVLNFISYYLLIKNPSGKWQILHDLPYAIKK